MSLQTDSILLLPKDEDPVQPARRIAGAFENLAPSVWLVPDKFERGGVLEDVFEILIGHALRAGGFVYMTQSGNAAAVWMPWNVPAVPEDYDEQLAAAAGEWLPRFQVFDAALDAAHLQGVEHHHLALLAVDARERRRGYGRALLAEHHRVLDERGLVGTLDAATARLADRFYTSAGYRRRGELIQLPDGPAMVPMRRDPK